MKRTETVFGSPIGARSTKMAVIALSAICAAALFAFASCASAPKEPAVQGVRVKAFDTLETDALVYLSVPVAAHKELSGGLLKKMIGSDVSDKYVNEALSSVDKVYIGLGSRSDKSRLQIACDGSVSAASKFALSKSDWFDKKTAAVGGAAFPVFVEKKSGVQLCAPRNDLILIASDIDPQLKRYDSELSAQDAEGADGRGWKDGEAYKYVGENETDNVRLYMNRPLSFITNLLGTALSSAIFQLNYIKGDFSRLPSGKYSVDLNMEFSRDNLIGKAAAFLKVALLMTDSKVTELDARHLSVTGIQVSLAQMQNMLGIR